MSHPALVPSALYGLRTWRVVGAEGAERLAGPQRGGPWPPGGAWAVAACQRDAGHAAPAAGCACGIHAWHPSERAARAVLAGRGRVAGVVEAAGEVEVHEDGFRAQRGRPFALACPPRRNAALLRRVAEAYGVPLVEVRDGGALARWCRERGLGLDERAVEDLLGRPPGAAARRRRAEARRDALRVAAAVLAGAALVAGGLAVAGDTPHGKTLHGRAGAVKVR